MIFTIENQSTDSYRTFKIEQNETGGISLFRQKGRDANGIIWQSIGFVRVRKNDDSTYIALHKWAAECSQLCPQYIAKYGQCVHAELVKMKRVIEAFDAKWEGIGDIIRPNTMIWDAEIEGTYYTLRTACSCRKCGEILTTPQSITFGIGPVCGKYQPTKIGKVW